MKTAILAKEFDFAKRTTVQIEKNHIDGLQSRGAIIMTSHGFIADDKKAIDNNKDTHKGSWANTLGSTDFTVTIEAEVGEDVRTDMEMLDE